MHARYTLLLLAPLLAGCRHADHADHAKKDDTNFNKRLQCSKLSYDGMWENLVDGPFLDGTYYSPSLDTCVFVMKHAHRAEKNGGIHNEVTVIDALTRKPLWGNDPEADETEDQVSGKLNQELKSLQINP